MNASRVVALVCVGSLCACGKVAASDAEPKAEWLVSFGDTGSDFTRDVALTPEGALVNVTSATPLTLAGESGLGFLVTLGDRGEVVHTRAFDSQVLTFARHPGGAIVFIALDGVTSSLHSIQGNTSDWTLPAVGDPGVGSGGIRDVVLATDGGLFVAGSYGGPMTFAGLELTPSAPFIWSPFVASVSSAGEGRWGVTFDVEGDLRALPTSDGGVLVVTRATSPDGSSVTDMTRISALGIAGPVDRKPSPFPSAAATRDDYVVMAGGHFAAGPRTTVTRYPLELGAAPTWLTTLGEECESDCSRLEIETLTIASNEHVFLGGRLLGAMTLGSEQVGEAGRAQLVVLELDAAGNVLRAFVPSSPADSIVYDVLVDDGSVVVVGLFRDTLAFEFGEVEGAGEWDVFAARIRW